MIEVISSICILCIITIIVSEVVLGYGDGGWF